jgi:hypothetical protein
MEKYDQCIVMSFEELKELAIAMVREWVDETSDGSVIEDETEADLINYLKSKGLKNPSDESEYASPRLKPIPTEDLDKSLDTIERLQREFKPLNPLDHEQTK